MCTSGVKTVYLKIRINPLFHRNWIQSTSYLEATENWSVDTRSEVVQKRLVRLYVHRPIKTLLVLLTVYAIVLLSPVNRQTQSDN